MNPLWKDFEAHFLEQARRALTFNNQCQYCMTKAGGPDQNSQNTRLIEALRFANTFAISHEAAVMGLTPMTHY